MNITVTIPNDQSVRLINALCVRYGYQEFFYSQDENEVIVKTPNPQTKAQFARASIMRYLKELVGEIEFEEAKRSIKISDIEII